MTRIWLFVKKIMPDLLVKKIKAQTCKPLLNGPSTLLASQSQQHLTFSFFAIFFLLYAFLDVFFFK
jgi:hypothetical protein